MKKISSLIAALTIAAASAGGVQAQAVRVVHRVTTPVVVRIDQHVIQRDQRMIKSAQLALRADERAGRRMSVRRDQKTLAAAELQLRRDQGHR